MKPRIRINLIPVWEVHRAGRRRLHQCLGSALIATTALALLALTWRDWNTEAELRTRLHRMGGEIASGGRPATTELPLQQRVEAIQTQLSMLEDIGRRPVSHEDILRNMARSLPHSVWLTRFEMTEAALILEGRAKDHKLIAQFLQELESQPHLVDNELVEVHQPKEGSGEGSTRFSTRSHIASGEETAQPGRETLE